MFSFPVIGQPCSTFALQIVLQYIVHPAISINWSKVSTLTPAPG
jgi:hypothetical protein